jgi:serine/threonine protein kinase
MGRSGQMGARGSAQVYQLHTPVPGFRLAGRYECAGRIHRGKTSDVWAGRDVCSGRPVAVKLARADFRARPSAVEELRREADALMHFEHPHVTKLGATGMSEGGRLFLVLEPLDGETLAERVRRGALSAHQVRALAEQLSGALHAVHRAGWLHGALSTDNVFLRNGTRSSAVYGCLIDFGAARRMPRWHLNLDVRTDMHALGRVLRAAAGGTIDVLPRFQRAILQTLLDPDPSRRPTSAGVVADLLRTPRRTTQP